MFKGNKKEYAALVFLLIISIICHTISSVGGFDEIWQYTTSYHIRHGLMIYRDFNCVSTPLYYYVMSIPLYIRDSMFSYLLFKGILAGGFAIFCYYIMKKMSLGTRAAIAAASAVTILDILSIFHYNQLVLFFALAGWYTSSRNGIRNSALSALAASAAVLTKQSAGTVMAICVIFSFFYIRRKSRKEIITFLLTGAICVGSFIFWLMYHGIWDEFFSFTVKAVGSFGKNNYISIWKLIFSSWKFFLFFNVIFVLSLICAAKLIGKKDRIGTALSILVTGGYFFLYPIANYGHYIAMLPLTAVFLIYGAGRMSVYRKEKGKSDAETGGLRTNRMKLSLSPQFFERLFVLSISAFSVMYIMVSIGKGSVEQRGCYGGARLSDEDYHFDEILEMEKEYPDRELISPEPYINAIKLLQGNPPSGLMSVYLNGNITEDPLNLYQKDKRYLVFFSKEEDDIFWQVPACSWNYVKEYGTEVGTTENFRWYLLA